MTFYEVTSTWYSNGTVTADIRQIESDSQPTDIQIKGFTKDVYKEFFFKEHEARKYMSEIVTET